MPGPDQGYIAHVTLETGVGPAILIDLALRLGLNVGTNWFYAGSG